MSTDLLYLWWPCCHKMVFEYRRMMSAHRKIGMLQKFFTTQSWAVPFCCQNLYPAFLNGVVQCYLSWSDMSHWLVLRNSSELSDRFDTSTHTARSLSLCQWYHHYRREITRLNLCQNYFFQLLFFQNICRVWLSVFTLHFYFTLLCFAFLHYDTIYIFKQK